MLVLEKAHVLSILVRGISTSSAWVVLSSSAVMFMRTSGGGGQGAYLSLFGRPRLGGGCGRFSGSGAAMRSRRSEWMTRPTAGVCGWSVGREERLLWREGRIAAQDAAKVAKMWEGPPARGWGRGRSTAPGAGGWTEEIQRSGFQLAATSGTTLLWMMRVAQGPPVGFGFETNNVE